MAIGVVAYGYVGVGVIVATVLACVRHLRAVDAILAVTLWPVYAPFLLVGAHGERTAQETELVAALTRAAVSPLAVALPDAESVRVLGTRLRDATARLAELDAVLARPDFDVPRAEARVHELAARGATHAAATAQLRVKTLGQLHAMRARFRGELDEIHELVAQLVAQAELVRLDPTAAHGNELVRELVARLEGLDELLEYPSSLASLA